MDLRTFLKQNDLTITGFGVTVGVTNRQTMWRYVEGRRMPPAETLRRIREATKGQVTADDFVAQCAPAREEEVQSQPVAA